MSSRYGYPAGSESRTPRDGRQPPLPGPKSGEAGPSGRDLSLHFHLVRLDRQGQPLGGTILQALLNLARDDSRCLGDSRQSILTSHVKALADRLADVSECCLAGLSLRHAAGDRRTDDGKPPGRLRTPPRRPSDGAAGPTTGAARPRRGSLSDRRPRSPRSSASGSSRAVGARVVFRTHLHPATGAVSRKRGQWPRTPSAAVSRAS